MASSAEKTFEVRTLSQCVVPDSGEYKYLVPVLMQTDLEEAKTQETAKWQKTVETLR